MDFDFSNDQEQLRDAVQKWVEKAYTFERRNSIVKEGGFSRAAWNELAELGLCGLYIAEDHGGMGMGPIEGMVAMEELGRGIVMEPLAHALIAGGVLSGYAPADVQATWLPQIASGEALVVLAHQERAARYNLEKCEAKATAAQAGWTLISLVKEPAGAARQSCRSRSHPACAACRDRCRRSCRGRARPERRGARRRWRRR